MICAANHEMEPAKSRDSKDRIDKRKVPGGDGNTTYMTHNKFNT